MDTIDLAGEWTLVRDATRESFPARVPGDTHSALLAAGRIPDPYVGRNELEVQWVGREDWTFERELTVPAALLSHDVVSLSCDSLDTVAEVRVNGRIAGHADNMFVRWRFDVKRLLRPGRNTVAVRFTSAEKAALAAARQLPYPVPCTGAPVSSPHRNLVRKVQCHSGWDWGPCLMVAGIHGRIALEAHSDVCIDYVHTEQRHTPGRCVLTVHAECEAARAGEYPFAVRIGDAAAARTVRLEQGSNTPSVSLTIRDPRLWWPNGLGSQPLYDLSVRVARHEVTKRIGLRRLELVNRADRHGMSMTFKVNGTEVFCKGANWIPADALPQRQTREKVAHLLDSAARAHMNMLRVWGGGQYESDEFYSLCDEKGILVWQDMMFSCSLYPASPRFLASVDREIRHQVKRLRDHPCIALWCGNNEDVGALTWYPESRKNRDRYLVDYDRLNEGVIGRAVDECDPTRVFWPSSPCAGRGDYSDNWHDDSRGDMHYWSVWHEGKPFSAFHGVAPRFCSEFGYQSFPSLPTIRSYAAEDELNATSPVMEHHQRHPRGNSAITEMFTRYFRVPEGFESFVYLSQVQQAMAIRTAVEHWRSLRPRCMGTLYWQLNDVWPVCSWSSVEHSGAWKLLHYAAARFFAPVLLAGRVHDGGVEIRLTNDLLESVTARVTMSVFEFSGRLAGTESWRARVPAGSSRLVARRPLSKIAPDPDKVFVSLSLERGTAAAESELFLVEPKRCTLAQARVRAAISGTDKAPVVDLSTDAPAFFVSLHADGIAGEFEDNCFTLLPGAPRALGFRPRQRVSLERFRRAFSLRHLRDTYR